MQNRGTLTGGESRSTWLRLGKLRLESEEVVSTLSPDLCLLAWRLRVGTKSSKPLSLRSCSEGSCSEERETEEVDKVDKVDEAEACDSGWCLTISVVVSSSVEFKAESDRNGKV